MNQTLEPSLYAYVGYTPVTSSSLIHSPGNISRQLNSSCPPSEIDLLHPKASKMLKQFNTERQQATEALLLTQYFQRQAYDKG